MNWPTFWEMFHREWGNASGSATYNKENWKAMQGFLTQLQEMNARCESLEQPSPLQNAPNTSSDGTLQNSYEGALLPPFMTVGGIRYNIRQVVKRLEVLQTIIAVAYDEGQCNMLWKTLRHELPDVEEVEGQLFPQKEVSDVRDRETSSAL